MTEPLPPPPDSTASAPPYPAAPPPGYASPPSPPAYGYAPTLPGYGPLPPVPPKSGMATWLKVVLITGGAVVVLVVLLVVGLVLLVNHTTADAVKVSNQLVADIQTDNPTAAYRLTSPAFRNVTTPTQLAQVIGTVSPALQGNASVSGRAIDASTGHADEAVIVYRVDTDHGTRYIRVVLVDDHPWQVLNFRSSSTPLSTSSGN
jgi:hypothetical protein